VSAAGEGREGNRGPRGATPPAASRRRSDLPRRVGDVLTPALDRLATGDEARAYSAWARAVGDPVTGGTRPKAFRRGQLTIECASSVWVNELTYLGPQILRRMDEVAPGHPVQRFRFVLGRFSAPTSTGDARAPAPPGAPGGASRAPVRGTSAVQASGRSGAAAEAPASATEKPPEAPRGQGSGGSATKEGLQRQQPARSAQDAARAQVEGVGDERLRAAIESALRRSSEEPPEASGRGTSSG
jgi:hypothetical protein